MVRVPSRFRKAAVALFGETPSGMAGAALQWLTLTVLVAMVVPDISLAWRLAIAPVGVVALLAGVVLALRGGSLGPLIAVPAVLGVVLVILLAILLYPFRWFMAVDDLAEP